MVYEESLLSSLLLYGSCLFVDVCMCMMYGVCEGSETGYFGGVRSGDSTLTLNRRFVELVS